MQQALTPPVRPLDPRKREKLARATALALEFNTPIKGYLHQLGVSPPQWQALKQDRSFLVEVNDARKAITTGNGLLRESMLELLPLAVQRVGEILRDPEIHPQWAVKCAEIVFRESGQAQSVQPDADKSGGGGFSLTINIPSQDGAPPRTIQITKNPEAEEEEGDDDFIEGEAVVTPTVNL